MSEDTLDLELDMDTDMDLGDLEGTDIELEETSESQDTVKDTIKDTDIDTDTDSLEGIDLALDDEISDEESTKSNQTVLFSSASNSSSAKKEAAPKRGSLFQNRTTTKKPRNIELHKQYPRDMFLDDVHNKLAPALRAKYGEDFDHMPKAFSQLVLSVVEETFSEVVNRHAFKFAGMQFSHSPIAGRENPNPRNLDYETYTPAHVRLRVNKVVTEGHHTITGKKDPDQGFIPDNAEDKDYMEKAEKYVAEIKRKRSEAAPANKKS